MESVRHELMAEYPMTYRSCSSARGAKTSERKNNQVFGLTKNALKFMVVLGRAIDLQQYLRKVQNYIQLQKIIPKKNTSWSW